MSLHAGEVAAPVTASIHAMLSGYGKRLRGRPEGEVKGSCVLCPLEEINMRDLYHSAINLVLTALASCYLQLL